METKATVHEVTIALPVEENVIVELVDDIGSSVRIWASEAEYDAEKGELVIVAWDDPDEQTTTTTKRVPWQKLADTLALMAQGVYLDFDGSRKGLSAYHARAALTLLVSPTEADWDADTVDVLVQMAAHDAVLYG